MTSWQDAVAQLAGERTRAETCAAVLKQFGDETAIAVGALAYGEAKAEFDAVIAGLVVALSQDKKPDSVPDLEARLTRGIELREAFCGEVQALVPRPKGARGGISDILGAGKVLEVLRDLLFKWVDADEMTRKTIQTQLEATRWPNFTAVKAAG